MSLELGFEMEKDSDHYNMQETETMEVYDIEALREASQVNGNPTQFAAYGTRGKDGISTLGIYDILKEQRIDPAAVSESELSEENIGHRGIISMASFDMFSEGKQIDFKKPVSQNLIAMGFNTLGRIFPHVLSSNILLPLEVNAYEEACKTDADVIEFNNELEAGTGGRILAALVNDDHIHLSLTSLCEVTTAFCK